MAGAGGRRLEAKGQAEKEAAKKRAKLIKDANTYWKKLQKQWGAKNVGLQIVSTREIGGQYWQPWEGKDAKVKISIPTGNTWANAVNKRGGNTTPLKELQFIMRHEMSHHRQFLKEKVGRNPDKKLNTQNEKWHGPAFQKQHKQIGGGRDLRGRDQLAGAKRKPKRPKAQRSRANIARKPMKPKAQMSRKNIARAKARLGPPSDRMTEAQRRRRLTG